jgi:hypothetical protein
VGRIIGHHHAGNGKNRKLVSVNTRTNMAATFSCVLLVVSVLPSHRIQSKDWQLERGSSDRHERNGKNCRVVSDCGVLLTRLRLSVSIRHRFQSKYWKLERERGDQNGLYGKNGRCVYECGVTLTRIHFCASALQFNTARAFNKNIGNWDVRAVTSMSSMVRTAAV